MTTVFSPTQTRYGQGVIVWTLTELHFGSKYTDFIQGLGRVRGWMMEQVWRGEWGTLTSRGKWGVGRGKYPDLHSITSLLGLPWIHFFLLLCFGPYLPLPSPLSNCKLLRGNISRQVVCCLRYYAERSQIVCSWWPKCPVVVPVSTLLMRAVPSKAGWRASTEGRVYHAADSQIVLFKFLWHCYDSVWSSLLPCALCFVFNVSCCINHNVLPLLIEDFYFLIPFSPLFCVLCLRIVIMA